MKRVLCHLIVMMSIALVPASRVAAASVPPASSESLETQGHAKVSAAENLRDSDPGAAASLLTEAGRLYIDSAARTDGGCSRAWPRPMRTWAGRQQGRGTRDHW